MNTKPSLREALAGIKEAQAEPQQIDVEDIAGKPLQPKPNLSEQIILAEAKRVVTKKAVAPSLAAQPIGAKSSNPDFMQLKVYVRKTTKRQAARKWEDENGGDVSDLIENLLQKYLSS